MLEFGTRLYWTTQGLNFFSCQRHLIDTYYPIVPGYLPFTRPAGAPAPSDSLDILILGGSVVNPTLGPIPTALMERLTHDLNVRVNIFDVAYPSHTSYDSYLKYLAFAQRRFDLVILYNGINDLRANNCPPAMFQDDYSHLGWYQQIAVINDGQSSRILAFPVTLHLLWVRVSQRLGLAHVMPEDASVNPEWNRYGSDIKTAAPFRANVESMVRMAAQRNEKIVLMTFASYEAPGYDIEKFNKRELGYQVHWFATQIWGMPGDVTKGLATHNTIIRDVASAHSSSLLFVDQAKLVPPDGRYYDDICHFSTAGCQRFVENMLPTIEPYLRQLLDSRQTAAPARSDAPTTTTAQLMAPTRTADAIVLATAKSATLDTMVK